MAPAAAASGEVVVHHDPRELAGLDEVDEGAEVFLPFLGKAVRGASGRRRSHSKGARNIPREEAARPSPASVASDDHQRPGRRERRLLERGQRAAAGKNRTTNSQATEVPIGEILPRVVDGVVSTDGPERG